MEIWPAPPPPPDQTRPGELLKVILLKLRALSKIREPGSAAASPPSGAGREESGRFVS